jgi:hypothetical protein
MALAANPLRQERRKGQTGGWPPFDHNAPPNLRVDPFPVMSPTSKVAPVVKSRQLSRVWD